MHPAGHALPSDFCAKRIGPSARSRDGSSLTVRRMSRSSWNRPQRRPMPRNFARSTGGHVLAERI